MNGTTYVFNYLIEKQNDDKLDFKLKIIPWKKVLKKKYRLN